MHKLRHLLLPLLFAAGWLSSAGGSTVDGDVLEVSMVKLNNIEYRVGDDLPDWVTALDGETVRISGFMRNGTLEGEQWFDLTNDSCGCGTSKLQHFVRISLGEGTTTFTPDELVLEGTFSVGEQLDEDEFVESIFRLKVDSL
jgi:hypothetical protein